MKNEKNNIKLYLFLFMGIIFLFSIPFELNALYNSSKLYPSDNFNLKNSNNLKFKAKTEIYNYQDAIYFLASSSACPYLELIDKDDDSLKFNACILEDQGITSPDIDEDEDSDTGLEKIRIQAEDDEILEGEFEITYYQDKPSKLSLTEQYNGYSIYKDLKINSDFSDQDIEEVDFYLRVETEWLEENGIEKEKIKFVQSQDDGENIEELRFEIDDDDEDFIVYKVESNNLTKYLTTLGKKKELTPKVYVGFLDHTFGEIEPGHSSNALELTIENRGNGDLVFDSIALEDNENFFLDKDSCKEVEKLGKDEKCRVFVSFKPQEKGDFSSKIMIESNDPERPRLEVVVKGKSRKTSAEISENSNQKTNPSPTPNSSFTKKQETKPKIYVSSLKYQFEVQNINEKSQVKILNISNEGEGNLRINRISLLDSAHFYLNKNPRVNPCKATPFIIEPGKSCQVELMFYPKYTDQFVSGIQILSNDSDKSPFKIELSGKLETNENQAFQKEDENQDNSDKEKNKSGSGVANQTQGDQENDFSMIQTSNLLIKDVSRVFPFSLISQITAFIVFLLSIVQVGSKLNSPRQFISSFLAFFNNSTKNKIGVVYDGKTGQPLSFAEILIYKENGDLLEKKSADKYGCYFFQAPKGKFTLKINKKGYRTIKQEEIEQLKIVYEPVYTKSQELVLENQGKVDISIPVLKEGEQNLTILNNKNFHIFIKIIFWVGFAFSILTLILYLSVVNFLIILLYLLCLLLRIAGIYEPKWGLILNEKNQPQTSLLVEVQNSSEETLARAVTDKFGRFAFILKKGKYSLKIKDADNQEKAEKFIELSKRKAVNEKIVL
ncbi:MAG: choice-of-anchor D domain-containing protein [Candidatus Moranbacteria bacterium]|nr:choice-of-anchor D domain-containing protein [Candidatus Moranbacteria bacterium]